MLNFLENYAEHVMEAYVSVPKIKVKKGINKIVVGGMGGSAIPGDILRSYLDDEIDVPIFVERRYKMPKFIDKKTLVFMVSYSGNTEESLSMLEDARKRGCQIILLTSDGKFSKKRGLPIIKVPQGHVPRVAFPYLFFPILKVLEDNKIIRSRKKDVEEVVSVIKKFNREKSREIAKKFFRRMPLLYGPEEYRGALYRWQTQLNENSKKLAHYNCFTEMNHNEIVSDFEDNKDAFAVVIEDNDVNKRVKLQMNLSMKILSKEIEVMKIRVKGNSLLAKIFYIIYLGDYCTYYLAKSRAVDPEENDNIKIIKKGLKK